MKKLYKILQVVNVAALISLAQEEPYYHDWRPLFCVIMSLSLIPYFIYSRFSKSKDISTDTNSPRKKSPMPMILGGSGRMSYRDENDWEIAVEKVDAHRRSRKLSARAVIFFILAILLIGFGILIDNALFFIVGIIGILVSIVFAIWSWYVAYVYSS